MVIIHFLMTIVGTRILEWIELLMIIGTRIMWQMIFMYLDRILCQIIQIL